MDVGTRHSEVTCPLGGVSAFNSCQGTRETIRAGLVKPSDSARPKCSADILSGQHSPCSDILKYFRTNDKSIISFKVYL